MISRVSLFGFLILIALSCEKTERAVITGIVTDEVTGNPVSGASVSMKIDYTYDAQHFSKTIQGTATKTASDCSYTIVYEYNNNNPELGAMNVVKLFPESYYTYASAPGYIGSDLHSLSDNNLENADIILNHSARINLHVKNGGINELNEGYIWLDRGLFNARFEKTELYFICKGQNFDSTFIINNAWGDFKYSYGVIATKGSYSGFFPFGETVLSGSVFPEPDSITDLFITF